MDWQLWKELSDKEQDEFKVVINILISQTFVLEHKFNTLKGQMETNSQYRFIEQHITICEQYLQVGGWKLYEDPTNGVFFVENEAINIDAKFDTFTTLFYLILRVIYAEKKASASLNRVVKTTIKELLEKGETLRLISGTPAKKDIEASLKKLKRFMLIEKHGGDYDNPDTALIIYPSIVHLIDNDVVEALASEFAELNTVGSDINEELESGEFSIEDTDTDDSEGAID